MRKLKLSLVVVMLSMVSLVSAQYSSFSVKGGLNMSNFYGDKISDKSMKTGFNIGVGAEFEFSPNMAIQSGLFFTSKGAKYTTDIANTEVNLNANFLQLPIHFAYKMDVMPGTKVLIHAGPYVAYGVGGKVTGTFAGNEIFNFDTFDEDSNIKGLKSFDAGLGLGIGAEFGKILIDLGWDMGLVNLSKADGNLGENIKTQNAYISLGYKF